MASNLDCLPFELGLQQTSHDHCLFVKITALGPVLLVVYVDDILLTGVDTSTITHIKEALHDKFTIKDLGRTSYYRTLKITTSATGLYVSQSKFASVLLLEVQVPSNSKTHTPCLPIQKTASDGTLFDSPKLYRKVVDKLLYLAFSRPDLYFAVQQLSQHMHLPTNSHWQAAVHLLQYVQNAVTLGLHFPYDNPLLLTAYSDSDWGNCIDTRKSLSGYCIFLGRALIACKTKKQSVVSRSSTDAAPAAVTSEILWLTYGLQ